MGMPYKTTKWTSETECADRDKTGQINKNKRTL